MCCVIYQNHPSVLHGPYVFMLPSYIFEECFGISFYDFLFENLVFELRIATGAARGFGLTDSALPEPGAGTHLSRAGLTTEKLNRSLQR